MNIFELWRFFLLNFFSAKVVTLSVKNFHRIHDGIKILWKKLTPDRYLVQKKSQPKKRRHSLVLLKISKLFELICTRIISCGIYILGRIFYKNLNFNFWFSKWECLHKQSNKWESAEKVPFSLIIKKTPVFFHILDFVIFVVLQNRGNNFQSRISFIKIKISVYKNGKKLKLSRFW